MKSIVNKNILKVKPYVPGKPIEEVQRELGLREVVKLASNENPYRPSPQVLKAIAQAAKNINRYPDGSCYYLRKELAKRLKVSENHLIFGNGSDELIVLALRALINSGDEVVVARPAFLIYEIAAQIVGAKIKAVPLKDFSYDLVSMKKAISKKTKIVFIGNPDNPAGTYVTSQQIKHFLKGLRQDLLVFFDEAYFEYVKAKDYPDTVKLLRQHKNIFITRTFSKMYGLAGLRIGYGIGHPELVDWLNRIREPFNVNSLAQAAALACLKDRSYYRQLAQRFQKQRDFLYHRFEKMGLIFKKTATNFILIDVQKNGSEVAKELLKKGVIVRDMVFWGLKSFIRITIGTEQENKKLVRSLQSLDLGSPNRRT